MKKYLLLIIGLLLIISLLIGTSYAYWYNTHIQENNNIVNSGCFSIEFSESSDSIINFNNAYPILDAKGMETNPYKFTIKNTCDIYANFKVNIELLESSTLNPELLKVSINNNQPKNASQYESTNPTINGAIAYTILSGGLEPSQTKFFDFRMWLDESATLEEAQGKIVNLKITIASNATEKPSLASICNIGDNLSQCIVKFYETFGEGNAGLYFHDQKGNYEYSTLEAGDNSYRYSGSDPDNYVCFGSPETICPNSNIYRIIGVFDNKVKLVKASFYQNNYWSGLSTSSDNTWSNSSLNIEVLNNLYLTELGNAANMIAESTWSVGGITNGQRNTNASSVYSYEVGNQSTHKVEYQAKVGLIYISDFAFSTIPSNWNKPVNTYNSQLITKDTWLFNSLEWTISPQSDSSSHAYFIDGSGLVFGDLITLYNIGVRPTFYLKKSINFNGGDGTANNPYRLS